jgi:deazaflavin-dependent oxidoreductase (nitroreductase family)
VDAPDPTPHSPEPHEFPYISDFVLEPVPKLTTCPSSFVIVVTTSSSIHRMRGKYMATTSKVPKFLRWANAIPTALLRAGVKLAGPGGHPMYLLTVPGRKSGLPRTTPIATLLQDGNRYVLTPYGVVDWVRNLRASGTGTLTRARRDEQVRAIELPGDEAARVLNRFMAGGNPMGRFFGFKPEYTIEDYERWTAGHPVFMLQSLGPDNAKAA